MARSRDDDPRQPRPSRRRKEARSRLRSEPVGLTTAPPTASAFERRIVVPEFWVLGTDGPGYELAEPDWRAAEVGHALTVCR